MPHCFNRFAVCVAICIAALFFALERSVAGDAAPLFDIPKLADMKIDGKADDWGDKGFRVDALCDVAGRARPPTDFDVAFRLGWNDAGLLVLVTVSDDIPLEPAEKPEDLWQGDSIEFFVATGRGAEQSYQVVVAPGRDPKKPELRSNISDYRAVGGKKEKLTVEAARTINDKGYVLEVLLPWKNLGIEPKEGVEFAFQLYANDVDKENERFQALWYPRPDAHSDTHNTQRIRLAADKASRPEIVASAVAVDAEGKMEITLIAPDGLKDRIVFLMNGAEKVSQLTLNALAGRASAKISLPKATPPYGSLIVNLDAGKHVEPLGTVVIPEPPK